jgi:hypothetical protein
VPRPRLDGGGPPPALPKIRRELLALPPADEQLPRGRPPAASDESRSQGAGCRRLRQTIPTTLFVPSAQRS